MFASHSIGFNNTNVELELASLKLVRATDYVLCKKFLLLRNFVPRKEGFENIKVNSLFTSQSEVKTVQSVI